jgi:hypothetical protein
LLSSDLTEGSWSLFSTVNDTYHALSGWSLYECSRAGETFPATPLPGAMWLFGTVLTGVADVRGWRRKRQKASLAV